ncbi:MAG: Gfo/Idh/MocA family oxidoreductase, partial [bacterium]
MAVRRRKARFGVIGCGRVARRVHMPYLSANPGAEIAAAYDANPENTRAACARFGGARRCSSPEELFDAGLDAVLICTPNWVRRELTLAAAERGINVFCEKPMAVTADECAEMVGACERAGVFLQVGMCKRFDAGIVKAKKRVMSGTLGEVSQVCATFFNPPARLDSPLVETAKKWGARLGIDVEAKLGLWAMTDRRTGGGMLLEMGTHLLDFLFFLTGEAPASWSGFVNTKRTDMTWEDQGTLVVKFPSGIIGTVEINSSVTADNLIGEKG